MKNTFFLLALCIVAMGSFDANAQLSWSSYDTSGNRVSASAAAYSGGNYTFTIPAGTTYTFIATSFTPVTLAGSQTQSVAFTLTASGGFGPSGTPVQNVRFLAFGLFNYGATAPAATGSFTDDLGLWTDSYQQTSGIATGVYGGTSTAANLLAYQSSRALGQGVGPSTGAVGQFTDGSTTNVTFRVVENGSGAASIGAGTSTSSAGVWYQDAATGGTTFNRTSYSAAATTPNGITTFNEFGFMFYNSTGSAVTLTLGSFTGLTPIFTTQPPATTNTTAGSDATLSVVAPTATSFQWQKSTDGGTTFSNVSGATSATLSLTNVQVSDGGIYNVIATSPDGNYTSANSTLSVTQGAPTLTTVFNDTFGNGSTINSNPTSPAAPTISKTAYQQLSAKTFNPNPPTITSGTLRYGSVATSSGFSSIESLFTQYPVILTNTNDYIEMTVVFTDEANLMNAANANLFFGLHNAGQVQPIPGGMNSTIATGTAGYAQNWQGYVSSILYSGGTHSIKTRPAQTGTAANNQDVLYNYSGATSIGTTTTPAVAGFTNGQQYTEVLRITKTGATAFTILSTLYQGADTSGTQIFTETATSSSILTSTFDALGIGFRPVGSVVTIINVNSIKVVTTASTTVVPVITSQPSPSSQTVSVGAAVSYSVVASGGGAALSYQWQKSTDGGINYTDISGSTGTTYVIASAILANSGMYRVQVSDVAGQTASNAVTLNVTTGPFSPSFTSQPSPASATVVAGTNVGFTAQVSGNPQPTVQWQKSTDGGSNYNNVGTAVATSPSTYAIASAQLSDAGLYRAVATNTEGSATSGTSSLAVQKGVTITTHPVGAVISSGSAYGLSVAVNSDATPVPNYLWQKTLDGVTFTTVQSGTLSGLSVTGSNSTSGFYRVIVSNSVNSGTSSLVYAGLASTTLGTGTFAPVSGATGINPDAPLTITFNQPASIGILGKIRVYDAANSATPVDTIDMSTAHLLSMLSGTTVLASGRFMQKTIGNLIFDYLPVIVTGNTVSITLHSSTMLIYGKTYYVNIEPGVLLDSTGATFPGVSNNTTWTFSTKASGPSPGATNLVVAADGSGDFNTVQGAIDFVPFSPANTIPRSVIVKSGTYTELVHIRTGQNLITLNGQSRSGTMIQYLNNNVVLGDLPQQNTLDARAVFSSDANDITLQSLSIKNLTPEGGSQAEAITFGGLRAIFNHISLYSYQDTFLNGATMFVTDSYIEGAVDYMWGGGPTFFQRCELKANSNNCQYTQARNPQTAKGFAYVNCTLDSYPTITGSTSSLSRTFNDFSQTIYINCKVGPNIKPAGWQVNAGTFDTLQLWEYQSKDLNGNSLDVSQRTTFNHSFSVSGTSIVYTSGATSSPDVLDHQQVSSRLAALFSTPQAFFNGTWSPTVAPTMDSSPSGTTLNPGQTAIFIASATGAPDPTYQWFKNGVAIVSATNATYSIPGVSGTDWGSYSVVASNSAGSATSSSASLIVNAPEALWANSYGLDPASNGAPLANPQKDGIPNGLKFILGADPTRQGAAYLPTAEYSSANNTPAFVFHYNENLAAASILRGVEYSTDLVNWTTAVSGSNGVTIESQPINSGTNQVTVTIPGVGSKVFGRLRASGF